MVSRGRWRATIEEGLLFPGLVCPPVSGSHRRPAAGTQVPQHRRLPRALPCSVGGGSLTQVASVVHRCLQLPGHPPQVVLQPSAPGETPSREQLFLHRMAEAGFPGSSASAVLRQRLSFWKWQLCPLQHVWGSASKAGRPLFLAVLSQPKGNGCSFCGCSRGPQSSVTSCSVLCYS